MTATGNELVTLNQLKTLKDSLGGLDLDENNFLINDGQGVGQLRLLETTTYGEADTSSIKNAGANIAGMAIYYEDRWHVSSGIGICGYSMVEDDGLPNYIQLLVSDDGDHVRDTVLSVCEGSGTIMPNNGYGIHLVAKNDDPTIMFKFRDSRKEECHAPATDSDFSTFLGIGG